MGKGRVSARPGWVGEKKGAVASQPRHSPLFREWGGDRPLLGLSPLGFEESGRVRK